MPINLFEQPILIKNEVGEIEGILFDIPRGKRYLTEPDESIEQKKQKRNTCWYYAYNFLRVRYGSKINPSFHHERRIEKCFSDYRKGCTAIDNKMIANNIFINKYHASHFNKKAISHFLSTHTILDHQVIFLNEFIQQNICNTLGDYVQFEDVSSRIKNCELLFSALGLEANEVVKKYFPGEKLDSIDLNKLLSVYHISIENEAARQYGLKPTTWNPRDGIEGLISVLKSNGPLKVAGRLGSSYYHGKPHVLDEQFGKRKIYGWKPGEYKFTSHGLIHAVVIIGAKKINYKKYVYFIDPNDPSTPGKKGKLYKISYDRLVMSIDNTIGQQFINTPEGCFGYHSDIDRFGHKISFHRFFKEYQSKHNDLVENEFKPVVF